VRLTRKLAGSPRPAKAHKTREYVENFARDQEATDARLWHPLLRINRVLSVMLRMRWSAEAWSVIKVEFKRALLMRSEIPACGW